MKIVMIGHTGVGKTTYMASLYSAMQQQVEGFCLTTNAQDHSRLINLAQLISTGFYPPVTAYRDEYNFSLYYQEKAVLEFIWADYKGGAIKEKRQSSKQMALLEKDLQEVDGIMMLCDCDLLARGNCRAIQLGRMTALIGRALKDLERPIALSIVLTKADQISTFEEDILDPFSGLISTINSNNLLFGAFIPVSCCHLLVNVPMPLLFTLHMAIKLQTSSMEEKYQNYYNSAKNWEKRSQGVSGFFRWVNDKWNGYTTDKQMAENDRKQGFNAYRNFQNLKEPTEKLVKYVNKMSLISPKKTIVNYIEDLNKIKSGISFNPQERKLFNSPNIDPFDSFK